MPQICPQPQQIILEKLQRLKCCTNCQNVANYLIFGYGLYCTGCLSQVKDVTPDQFVNFSVLSSILAQMIEQYQKKTKSQVSYQKVAKTETDKSKAQIKKLRDNLNFQIKSVKSKHTEILNQRFKQCLREHTVQQLQQLYEPSMTATTIMNEKDLLLINLNILHVGQNQKKEIVYEFEDKSRQPCAVFRKCNMDYLEVRNILSSSTEQVKGILDNFRVSAKKD